MYYLCLCIQYYLIKHDRIDNIFCDPFYRTFISTLDEIAHNFIKAYNDTGKYMDKKTGRQSSTSVCILYKCNIASFASGRIAF
jgi:hypothetical protein